MLKARTFSAAVRDYDQRIKKPKTQPLTELSELYLSAGCPDRRGESERKTEFIKGETVRSKMLLRFFGKNTVDETKIPDCHEYRKWRVKHLTRRQTGLRTVDAELTTLSNIINYAVLMGAADSNPLLGRPRFQIKRFVKHCREKSIHTGAELHKLGAHFFSDVPTEPLGFQMYFECLTGCRTAEILDLRTDAGPRQPGYIETSGDLQWLHVNRRKSRGDGEAYILVTPELAKCIDAHKAWHAKRYPKSPWYFPSAYKPMQTVGKHSLCHALQRAAKVLFGKDRFITSHGCRAFYVEWRRSSGESDSKIAGDLGHMSGGAKLIWEIYGRKPANWRGGPDLSPVQKDIAPAWSTWLTASGVSTLFPQTLHKPTRPHATNIIKLNP